MKYNNNDNKETIEFFLPVNPEVLKSELLELHGNAYVNTHFFKYIHLINLIFLKTRGEVTGQGNYHSLYNGNNPKWRKNTLRFVYGERFFPQIRKDLIDLGYIKFNEEYSIKGHSSKSYAVYSKSEGAFFKLYSLDITTNRNRFLTNKVRTNYRVETDTAIKYNMAKTLAKAKIDGEYIEYEKLYLKQSPLTDRVYHTIANMPSKQRKLITLDGEETVEIDVRNSQFLTLVGVVGKVLENKTPDYQKFINLVESGSFYEFMMEKTSTTKTYKEFKHQMFTILFGQNRIQNKVKEVFQNEFPTVANAIYTIKKKNYKFLNHNCTRLESKIIFNAVDRVQKAGIFSRKDVITVHDCLIVKKSDLDIAMKEIFRSFKEQGLNPTLRVNDNLQYSSYNEFKLENDKKLNIAA